MGKNASKLIAKLKKRSKGHWKQSRKSEGTPAGSIVPGGIVGGVAQIIETKFDADKHGEPYVSLTGTVIEPTKHKGKKFAINHFLAESQWTTYEEQEDRMFNTLKLLGIAKEKCSLDDIIKLLKKVKKDSLPFEFNSVQRDENSQIRYYVQGLMPDDYEPPVDDNEEEDEEEDEDDEEEEDDEDETKEEETEEDDDSEEEDEDEDEDEEEDDEETEEEEEEIEPEKGEIYLYKAGRGKAKSCEVKKVAKRKKTVTLKRMSDKKTFTDVPWSKLEPDE